MAKALDLSDPRAVNNAVTNICSTIATRPNAAAATIDRMEKKFYEHQQEIQQRFPHTFAYVTRAENKEKLKSGAQKCIHYFNDLKVPLLIDLQDNKELFQYMKHVLDQRLEDFINEIQLQSD